MAIIILVFAAGLHGSDEQTIMFKTDLFVFDKNFRTYYTIYLSTKYLGGYLVPGKIFIVNLNNI